MSFVSNNSFGSFSSAPDGNTVDRIFEYVSKVLQGFNGTDSENENCLTNKLCKALEYTKPPESPFFFHHQNLENPKENTTTDFAAFGTFAYAQQNNISDSDEAPPLIKFEAKRLSTALPKKREREYVIGDYEKKRQIRNSGGIERFKNGRHGKDVINAGIIGYVQSDSFFDWQEKINGWIQEEISSPHDSTLSWDNNDILILTKSDHRLTEFISKPKRKNSNSMVLRHLWINLIS